MQAFPTRIRFIESQKFRLFLDLLVIVRQRQMDVMIDRMRASVWQ